MSTLDWQRFPAARFTTDAGQQTEWDRLNGLQLDLPFLGANVVAAAIEVFGNKTEQLLIGSADGEVVAMLVLVPSGLMRWSTFQPSQMPLGAWVAERRWSPLDLSRSLLRGPLGLSLGLSITQIDPLVAVRQDDMPDTLNTDYIDTAWLDIVGGFDEYWAARGKNLRQNMRKQRNKLAAEGIVTTLRILRQAQEMAPVIARYGLLESAGWKGNEGTSIHADNQQGRFYIQLFESAARRGEAIIFEYLFNDKTAAINLCQLRNGILVVLKTTYDESIPKTLSPAFLLREDELKHMFASGEVRRIEYFGRRMDWHTKLTDAYRSLYHLTIFRWPLVKRLASQRRARLEARETRNHSKPGPKVDDPDAASPAPTTAAAS